MLKLQYFGHPMQRADSLEKTLTLGKIEGRRRGRPSMRWVEGITDLMEMSLNKLPMIAKGQGSLAGCNLWGRKERDMTERRNNPWR